MLFVIGLLNGVLKIYGFSTGLSYWAIQELNVNLKLENIIG
jgi:hypothetical protein